MLHVFNLISVTLLFLPSSLTTLFQLQTSDVLSKVRFKPHDRDLRLNHKLTEASASITAITTKISEAYPAKHCSHPRFEHKADKETVNRPRQIQTPNNEPLELLTDCLCYSIHTPTLPGRMLNIEITNKEIQRRRLGIWERSPFVPRTQLDLSLGVPIMSSWLTQLSLTDPTIDEWRFETRPIIWFTLRD